MRHLALIRLALVVLLTTDVALSQDVDRSHPIVPKVCTGNSPDGWGVVRNVDCPKNYAFFSQSARFGGVAGTFDSGHRVAVSGVCCPLPASDILLPNEQQILAVESCPKDFIITGGRDPECPDCAFRIVCTKINTNRYQLSKIEPGIVWGTSSTYWKIPKIITRGELPLGIRYGIGRTSKFGFANSGCVSERPGGLFVGRTSKHCSDYQFSALQFSGLSGDPKNGSPVEMFPKCKQLTNPIDETFRCVTQ